jgi:2-oxoglutarate ferredoxin oxidoreductase subunit gamma
MEIRISGLGGQGVVLAGQILGRAAVYSGKNAVQTQSYGAEARGSAAKSEVIISDGKIGFPMVRKCDVLIAMNQEAVEKNITDLKEDGRLIVDNSIAKNMPETRAKTFKIPATQTAETELGEKLYANILMLGAFTKITKIVDKESMIKAIEDAFPKKKLEKNIAAFNKGTQLADTL